MQQRKASCKKPARLRKAVPSSCWKEPKSFGLCKLTVAKEKSYLVCKAVPADKQSCLVNTQENVDHGAVGRQLMDYICQDDGLMKDMVLSKRDELKCKNYLQE